MQPTSLIALLLCFCCLCCKAELIQPSPEDSLQGPPKDQKLITESDEESPESPQKQNAHLDEDLSQLVSAKISFPNGEHLLDRKPTTMQITITNGSIRPIYALTLVPSYPKLKGAALQPIRLVIEVPARDPETKAPGESSQKFAFTYELDKSGSIDFSLDLTVFNFKDEKKPIVIPVFFGTLPIVRQTNEYFDAKALGIYAMFAGIAFAFYRLFLAGNLASSEARKRMAALKQKDKKGKSVFESDSDWIPAHHLKKRATNAPSDAESSSANLSE